MPLVAYQGVQIKRRAIRLPEASGPRQGSLGCGRDAEITVAVVGDSTAAGCGVGSHEEGLAGQFALAVSSARPTATVTWSVHARNGATVSSVRRSLLTDVPDNVHVILLSVGVNDVLRRTDPLVWKSELSALLFGLRRRTDRLIVAGLPPFESFPALPRTLARYLSEQGHVLDGIAKESVRDMPGVEWVSAGHLLPLGPDFFAVDGFHPGAKGYARWARSLATTVPNPTGPELADHSRA